MLIASSKIFAAMHPLDDILKTARNYVTKQFSDSNMLATIETGYLDPRLRLKKCTEPLIAEPLSQKHNNTNITVVVKCQHSTKPWTVYVPVKVKLEVEVVIVNRPLARGVAISAADISTEKRDITRLTRGYLTPSDNIIGRIPKRHLAKGAAVSPSDLTIEQVIQRGNRVSITAQIEGVTIRMPGEALANAGKGELIPVKNLSSKRTIEAIAVETGIVRVPM